jgi:hypothetical protein
MTNDIKKDYMPDIIIGTNNVPDSVKNYLEKSNEINQKLIDVTTSFNITNNNILSTLNLIKVDIERITNDLRIHEIDDVSELKKINDIILKMYNHVESLYNDISGRDGYLWNLNIKINYLWIPLIINFIALTITILKIFI